MPLLSAKSVENFKVALHSIRSQKGRTALTVLMIVLGIMALVTFNTAKEALQSKIFSEFSAMGSNTFTVRSGRGGMFGGQGGVRRKKNDNISYDQARRFTREFPEGALVSMSAYASGASVIKHRSNKTNPNVQVIGGDGDYIELSGYAISEGRNFSETDIRLGNNAVILGAEVVEKLFPDDRKALDKEVSIGSFKYLVVGVLEAKGASFGFSQDNQCLIPVSNLKKNFGSTRTDYSINVRVFDNKTLERFIDEAYGLMGAIRGDLLEPESTFQIRKSDAMASDMNEAVDSVGVGVTVIGYITLFGAAIGLMNIMLVSVTERTREIGVRKALGASSKTVMRQFLAEAVVIGQLGGVLGTLFGVLAGNAVSLFLSTPFTVPWGWILTGTLSCFIMSVLSGYFPARKAARLEPIDALRYE